MPDVVSICTKTDPIMMIRATSRTRKKSPDPDPNRMWENVSGKSDPARFRLPAGRNGHNWPDPERIHHVYWGNF